MQAEKTSLAGGQSAMHAATTAYLLRDVVLMDGALYMGSEAMHLHRRTRFQLFANLTEVAQRSALYCSFGGNTYFGSWLMDDCVSYPLAQSCGRPVRTKWPAYSGHMSEYSHILAMDSQAMDNTFFRELVVFDDFGQNAGKKLRAQAIASKLSASLDVQPHAGVFLVRGASGASRVLVNEEHVAQHLHQRYGLKVLDPTTLSIPQIVAACAGARMVVGVEGSHLLHGILHLVPGGSLLVLQPPYRYCSLLKGLTERDGQKFGAVVGKAQSSDGSFSIDLHELEQTADWMLAAP